MSESKLKLSDATRKAIRANYERIKAIQVPAPRFFHVSRYFTSKTLTRKDGTEYEVLVPSKGKTYKKTGRAGIGDTAPAV